MALSRPMFPNSGLTVYQGPVLGSRLGSPTLANANDPMSKYWRLNYELDVIEQKPDSAKKRQDLKDVDGEFHQLLDDFTMLKLRENPLLPLADFESRKHGGTILGQRPNHEPSTCFVLAKGNHSTAQYKPGGAYYNLLRVLSRHWMHVLVPVDGNLSAELEIIFFFEAVNDADYFVQQLRWKANTPLQLPIVDLLVVSISFQQYCNLAERAVLHTFNTWKPTLSGMPETFHTDHDGQLIVQVCAETDDKGSCKNNGNAAETVKAIAGLRAGVNHVKLLVESQGHMFMFFVMELNEHFRVDTVCGLFNRSSGIVENSLRFWAAPFNRNVYLQALKEVSMNFQTKATVDILYRKHLEAKQRAYAARPNAQPRGPLMAPLPRIIRNQNDIDWEAIEMRREHRSTVMFRNLPTNMPTDSFISFLNLVAPGSYTFVYVRKDFQSGNNVGYGFVDFVSPLVILRFEHAVGTPWPNSKKLCEVSFATFQGLDSLVEKFRNSAVMLEPFENQPRVFFAYPDLCAGMPKDFPGPTNKMKLYRSQESAKHLGLYKVGGHGRVQHGGMLDRGNPRGFVGGF